MADTSGDRRSRRSRRLLKQGLLELLREKGFSHISVRDITERMDMNRGTFYLHYQDTTALMRSIEADMLSEAQALIESHLTEVVEAGSLRPVFEPLLDYVVEHREACRSLFANDSGSGFLGGIQRLAYENGKKLIESTYHNLDDEKLSYYTTFAAFGLTGLMKAWFDHGMALPKEDLLSMADRMVVGSGRSVAGVPE